LDANNRRKRIFQQNLSAHFSSSSHNNTHLSSSLNIIAQVSSENLEQLDQTIRFYDQPTQPLSTMLRSFQTKREGEEKLTHRFLKWKNPMTSSMGRRQIYGRLVLRSFKNRFLEKNRNNSGEKVALRAGRPETDFRVDCLQKASAHLVHSMSSSNESCDSSKSS